MLSHGAIQFGQTKWLNDELSYRYSELEKTELETYLLPQKLETTTSTLEWDIVEDSIDGIVENCHRKFVFTKIKKLNDLTNGT